MKDRAAFSERFNVPRETLLKLDAYEGLLADWQVRMNLVGPSTLSQTWNRHFADSAQLLSLGGVGLRWLDIGAGGGFPGLVIATLDPNAHITLVESIAKKCRFLETVAIELELEPRVTIENRRIETLPRQRFDIITARALAPLAQIFAWARPFADNATRWVLPKGARWADEVSAAERRFHFAYEQHLSLTDDHARILLVNNVVPR
jgi:16S rRNA (guanine527-N7)-methyltransferase